MAVSRDKCIMRINFYTYDGEIKNMEFKGKQKLYLYIEKPLFGLLKIWQDSENGIYKILHN